MASFKDIIPQFTPYIQQLPVEDMVQVGMHKQQLYDQGVQKIQSQIDNIAGLDIIHDSDRAYLQSKLDELTSNLRGVAAGDFSDQNLVNSVSGMTSQLIKDKNIQNAVSSTAWFRKENQRMEKAIDEGKASPQNIADFNEQANQWLSSTKFGTSFRGRYKEYIDMDEKLRKVFAEMKDKADFTIDNPWKSDASGNPLYFNSDGTVSTDPSKGGKKQYDYSMISKTVKGTSAEKILNNFYDSIDENDKEQLMIDAKYYYRGGNLDVLKSDIKESAKLKKDFVSNEIARINTLLQNNNISAEDKNLLRARSKTLSEQLSSGEIEKESENILQGLEDPSQKNNILYQIYTKKTLSNLAKDLETQSISEEIKTNPAFQGYMEVQKFNFDQQKEIIRQQESNRDYQLSYNKYLLDVKKDRREEEADARERDKNRAIVKDGGINTDVEVPDASSLTQEIYGMIKSNRSELLSLGNRIGNSTDSKEQKIKNAEKLVEQYYVNPSGLKLDNATREIVEKLSQDKIALNEKLKAYKGVKEVGVKYEKDIKNAFKGEQGIRIANTYYSPEELYKIYSEAENDFALVSGAAYAGKKGIDESDRERVGGAISKKKLREYGQAAAVDTSAPTGLYSKDILEKYKNTKYYPLALAIYGRKNDVSEVTKSNNKFLKSTMYDLYEKKKGEIDNVIKEKNKAQSNYLAKIMPEPQTMNIGINLKNETDMNIINQAIGLKSQDYLEHGALDTKKPNDFDPEVVNKLTKDGKANYNIIKNYDGTAKLIITNGVDKQTIPLAANEFSNWFPQYAGINPMTKFKASVLSSSNKTTNMTGIGNPAGAAIHGYSPLVPAISSNPKISNKVRFDIEGSPNNIGADTDKYQIRVYYHSSKGWQDAILNDGGYKSEADILPLLQSVGPATINDLFKIK